MIIPQWLESIVIGKPTIFWICISMYWYRIGIPQLVSISQCILTMYNSQLLKAFQYPGRTVPFLPGDTGYERELAELDDPPNLLNQRLHNLILVWPNAIPLGNLNSKDPTPAIILDRLVLIVNRSADNSIDNSVANSAFWSLLKRTKITGMIADISLSNNPRVYSSEEFLLIKVQAQYDTPFSCNWNRHEIVSVSMDRYWPL